MAGPMSSRVLIDTVPEGLLCFQQKADDPPTLLGERQHASVPFSSWLHDQKALVTEHVDLLPGVGVAGDVPVDVRSEAHRMIVYIEQYVHGVG